MLLIEPNSSHAPPSAPPPPPHGAAVPVDSALVLQVLGGLLAVGLSIAIVLAFWCRCRRRRRAGLMQHAVPLVLPGFESSSTAPNAFVFGGEDRAATQLQSALSPAPPPLLSPTLATCRVSSDRSSSTC